MSDKAGRSRVFLHWLIAISIFFLFISSWWMLALPLPSENFAYRQLPFQLHKNIGITIFIITIWLLKIRIFRAQERSLSSLNKSEILAERVHLLIYFLIAFCCISGYLSSSYSGWDTTLWWLLDLPSWADESDSMNMLFSDLHLWSCWALLAVIVGHIGAALYRAFAEDQVIDKMYRW